MYVLRENLGLTAVKGACEQGECGSCTVLIDEIAVCSCITLAAAVENRHIVTLEGLELEDDLTAVIQRALLDHGGVQCGFCTPGFVIAIREFLVRNVSPSPIEVKEALSGNLCRCTGYGRILAAVQSVIENRELQ